MPLSIKYVLYNITIYVIQDGLTHLSKKDNVGGMGQHQKIFADWLYCISQLSHYSIRSSF